MPKVVLLEPLGEGQDASSLEQYGEVTHMFGFRADSVRSPSVFYTDAYMLAIRDWFESKFDPGQDYFVVAGRMTKIAFALVALREAFSQEPFTVLIFDGHSGGYVERTI